MTLSITQLNEILKNLRYPDHNILTRVIELPDPGGDSSTSTIYAIDGVEGIFLQINTSEDSYGGTDKVDGVKFVKETTKTVKSYE